MKQRYRKLFEEYLNGTVTPEEAEMVLGWLNTDEGKSYFNQQFRKDFYSPNVSVNDEGASEESYRQIRKRITVSKGSESFDRMKWMAFAAVLLLGFLISFFAYSIQENGEFKSVENTTLVYSTNTYEQRVLSLNDGSKIRLNSGASIEVPEYFSGDERRVKLTGEAFFQIQSNENKPFIVQAGETDIRVLGTEFSVKSNDQSNFVLVAVTEGAVSFGIHNSVDGRIQLTKNRVGIFDKSRNEFIKEQHLADNYLSWMHGRILFEKTNFEDAARQLSHIYDIPHVLLNDELKELRLTAELSGLTPEEVAQTIAYSLEIEVSIEDGVVYWSS
ncbi:FecR family protein [Rhodohalobacter halophilus]|uniref:FecR family protein n=1 Tax=Rhodohalobacter halophilus TaxID=1812810 RepID=UPI00083FAD62|nr:FecR domain-containing protein [Rhodohalobacter halophilus]